MPSSPSRPCPGRGTRRGNCKNLIKGSERCCSECVPYELTVNRKYDQERYNDNPARRFWQSPAGRRAREHKADLNPLCERCEAKGIIRLMNVVHHKDQNEFNNLDENLESLCTPCHEAIHKNCRFGRK